MKITVNVQDDLVFKIDREAQKDGHSNRNAVIRKVLQLFFDQSVNFSQTKVKTNKSEAVSK